MHVRIGAVAAALLLFTAGAVGLAGTWAVGAAVVLLVATSVVTVIIWEERDVRPPAVARRASERYDELVSASTPGR